MDEKPSGRRWSRCSTSPASPCSRSSRVLVLLGVADPEQQPASERFRVAKVGHDTPAQLERDAGRGRREETRAYAGLHERHGPCNSAAPRTSFSRRRQSKSRSASRVCPTIMANSELRLPATGPTGSPMPPKPWQS